ncbi:Endoribonuclease YbeY [Chlamydiales bacterium STE3]|nr:Endoribonuclease YbeY [Chlamydiales bacterium STE3]
MITHIENTQSDVPLNTSNLKEIIREILRLEEKKCDEIAIHFVDSNRICHLHEEYFNDPTLTDCITLPLDSANEEGYCILGDVFVCPKTAKDYISVEGGDLYEEITLYVIHGILHLLEYDDINEDEEKLMRLAERRHLNHLKEKQLILSSGPAE